jgi:O-antigen ligase
MISTYIVCACYFRAYVTFESEKLFAIFVVFSTFMMSFCYLMGRIAGQTEECHCLKYLVASGRKIKTKCIEN